MTKRGPPLSPEHASIPDRFETRSPDRRNSGVIEHAQQRQRRSREYRWWGWRVRKAIPQRGHRVRSFNQRPSSLLSRAGEGDVAHALIENHECNVIAGNIGATVEVIRDECLHHPGRCGALTPPLVIRKAVPGSRRRTIRSMGPPVVSSMTQCAAVNSTVGFQTGAADPIGVPADEINAVTNRCRGIPSGHQTRLAFSRVARRLVLGGGACGGGDRYRGQRSCDGGNERNTRERVWVGQRTRGGRRCGGAG